MGARGPALSLTVGGREGLSRPPGYLDLVLADGATSLWRLNEAAGPTAVDAIGGDHNLAYAGSGVSFGAAGPRDVQSGVSTGIAASTGVDAAAANVVAIGQQSFSIDGWSYWISGEHAVFEQGSNGFNKSIMLVVAGDGTLAVIMALTSSNRIIMTNVASMTADAWHHVAMTYDAAADVVRAYVDGVQVATAAWAGGAVLEVPTRVGGSITSYGLRGRLAAIAVYSGVVLPPTVVAAHASALG